MPRAGQTRRTSVLRSSSPSVASAPMEMRSLPISIASQPGNRLQVDHEPGCPALLFQLIEEVGPASQQCAILAVLAGEIDGLVERPRRQQFEGGGFVNGHLPHGYTSFPARLSSSYTRGQVYGISRIRTPVAL